MNRLRRGILPSIVASVLIATIISPLAGPLAGPVGGHTAVVSQWLRVRIGSEGGASVDSALNATAARSSRTVKEYVRTVAQALVVTDPRAAASIAGVTSTTSEALARVLEHLLSAMVRDAMLPHTFFATAKSAVVGALHRLEGLNQRKMGPLHVPLQNGQADVVFPEALLPFLPLLLVEQPQGP